MEKGKYFVELSEEAMQKIREDFYHSSIGVSSMHNVEAIYVETKEQSDKYGYPVGSWVFAISNEGMDEIINSL
jgi:hypothetical protein